jgi:hypothetical protein
VEVDTYLNVCVNLASELELLLFTLNTIVKNHAALSSGNQ